MEFDSSPLRRPASSLHESKWGQQPLKRYLLCDGEAHFFTKSCSIFSEHALERDHFIEEEADAYKNLFMISKKIMNRF